MGRWGIPTRKGLRSDAKMTESSVKLRIEGALRRILKKIPEANLPGFDHHTHEKTPFVKHSNLWGNAAQP